MADYPMEKEFIECRPLEDHQNTCQIFLDNALLGTFRSDDAAHCLEQLGLSENEALHWAHEACYYAAAHGKLIIVKE
jgi:hypothetical protein